MKIIIEGTSEEIAALVLELQERQGVHVALRDVSNLHADDLVGEEDNVAKMAMASRCGDKTRVR